MFDEPFAHGASLVHHFDPRVRLGTAILSSITVALLHTPLAATLALVLGACVLALSQPPWPVLWRRMAMVNVFVVFLWLIVPLTMPGPAAWTVGRISFSQAGLELTTLITLKANAIVCIFLALIATMNFPTMGHALRQLRVPAKVVFLFLFAYRYVHVIAAEWQRLRTSARLRGFVPGTNPRTYAVIGNLVGMVLVNSFDRSQRVYQAMILRGFSGKFTTLARFRATTRDTVLAGCGVVAITALIWLDIFAEGWRG